MCKQIALCFGLSCLLFLAIGCGKNCGLKGKVVFSDDQSPLTHGVVCFLSDQGIARGNIDENGNYVVSSISKNDGLPSGSYRIYLVDTDHFIPNPGGIPKAVPLIEDKYSKAETSGLTVEVKSSMTHNIEVDRFGGSR